MSAIVPKPEGPEDAEPATEIEDLDANAEDVAAVLGGRNPNPLEGPDPCDGGKLH